MHVSGWVLVSTEEQERSGRDIEHYPEAITREAERRCWTVEVFGDLACLVKHLNPQLRRALDPLRSGQGEGLMVAKLDHLARPVRHASAIIDDAIERGWSLVVFDNALDLTTRDGAMANMLATFAELERDLVSTLTVEAVAARKGPCLTSGRPAAIPAGVLRRVVLARDAGASYSGIARVLTAEGILAPTSRAEWQESTVRRAYAAATTNVATAA